MSLFVPHSLCFFLRFPSPSFPTSALHQEQRVACHCPGNRCGAASATATCRRQGWLTPDPRHSCSSIAYPTIPPLLSAHSRDHRVKHGYQRRIKKCVTLSSLFLKKSGHKGGKDKRRSGGTEINIGVEMMWQEKNEGEKRNLDADTKFKLHCESCF